MNEAVVYAIVFGMWVGFLVGIAVAALLQVPSASKGGTHG